MSEDYWIYQYTNSQAELDHLKSKFDKLESFYRAIATIANTPQISLSNMQNIEKELDKLNPNWRNDANV